MDLCYQLGLSDPSYQLDQMDRLVPARLVRLHPYHRLHPLVLLTRLGPSGLSDPSYRLDPLDQHRLDQLDPSDLQEDPSDRLGPVGRRLDPLGRYHPACRLDQ